MQEKIKFLMLCWRFYNGDVLAGKQALDMITAKHPEWNPVNAAKAATKTAKAHECVTSDCKHETLTYPTKIETYATVEKERVPSS